MQNDFSDILTKNQLQPDGVIILYRISAYLQFAELQNVVFSCYFQAAEKPEIGSFVAKMGSRKWNSNGLWKLEVEVKKFSTSCIFFFCVFLACAPLVTY